MDGNTDNTNTTTNNKTKCYYDDAYLTIQQQGEDEDDGNVVLIIRGYYFAPFFETKTIHLSNDHLISITEHPIKGLGSGSGRVWGTSNPKYWLHRDKGRFWKTTLFVLNVKGSPIQPTITPDDPVAFMQAIQQVVSSNESARGIKIEKSDDPIWC